MVGGGSGWVGGQLIGERDGVRRREKLPGSV